MNKMKNKKHPSCFNLGVPVFSSQQKPVVPWIPASVVEKLLSGTMPVFAKKDEKGLYLTWSRVDVEDAEVLGFVIGPLNLPPMELLLATRDEALASGKEVTPRDPINVGQAAEKAMEGTVHEAGPDLEAKGDKEESSLIIMPGTNGRVLQ